MKNIKKISHILGKYFSIFLITTLIISPSFALAKNDKNNGNKEKERKEVREREREQQREQEREREGDDDKNSSTTTTVSKKSNTKKCFQAWGHLIAPGWIKWNGESVLPENCIMPFGIGKKFGITSYKNSTTTDTVAPIITNIVSTPNTYSSVISWNTNEKSDTKVFYSTITPVNTASSNTYVKSDSLMTKNHVITLDNLSPNTTYYALVQSKDYSGNTATSSQISFTTKVAPIDSIAPVISYVVATVGTTTVSTGWKTNENATTKMYYSTTTPVNPLSSTTPFVENTNLVTNHLISAYGLSTSTTYYVLLESKDSAGNIQRTDQFSITTSTGL